MSENGWARGIANLVGEVRLIARRGRHVWGLVPRNRKLSLGVAVAVMGLASSAATAIPLGLGRLMDQINPETHRGVPRRELAWSAAGLLALIGLAYLVRETLNVLRRYLVEPRLHADRPRPGRAGGGAPAACGAGGPGPRAGRFAPRPDHAERRRVRPVPADYVPRLPAGHPHGLRSPPDRRGSRRGSGIALAMAGVVPLSLGLTFWQLLTQARRRAARPDAGPRADGRHRGRAARRARLRPRRQHRRSRDRPGRAGGRKSPRHRDPPRGGDVPLRQRQGAERGVLPPRGAGVRRGPVPPRGHRLWRHPHVLGPCF